MGMKEELEAIIGEKLRSYTEHIVIHGKKSYAEWKSMMSHNLENMSYFKITDVDSDCYTVMKYRMSDDSEIPDSEVICSIPSVKRISVQ